MKNTNLLNVPVLMIFFNREKQLQEVFDSVKRAKPSKLYLYQDGPRDGRKDDIKGITKCRNIVSDQNIDWQCEVHRFYQDKNQGCDPSEYIAQQWMFENEEMGIILEDDDVPSQSFYYFCQELLNKYKDDDRIHMICGMNSFDINQNTQFSYFFSQRGSIWGWATWKRVINSWDSSYKFLNDPEALDLLKQNYPYDFNRFIRTCKKHKKSGREHYESINGAAQFLNNRVNIVPKYNMIKNIGIASESTHSVNNLNKLPRKVQKLFYKKTYEIDFPLSHPKYILVDRKFDKKFETSYFEIIEQLIETKVRKIIYR